MLKRAFDLLLVIVTAPVWLPLLVLVALSIGIALGSPIVFRQARPGLNGKIFHLYKFRTMSDARDESGELLADELRLTGFGRFVRSMSLDELPSLLNVLRGDIALVGPRPLLVEYLDLYSPHQARRHEVKPGLTGWAQVKGRNRLGWEERLAMDVWYVDNRSLWLDIRILFATIGKVIRREGIAEEGSATMTRFTGKS